MLSRAIYSSAAIKPFSEQQLVDLLAQSRRDNLAADLTGMLLYKDGNFMQTLEGPETAVKKLLEKIRKDPRHHKFNILNEGPIMERSFALWSMAFKKITPETVIDLPGYHNSDDFSLLISHFLQNPSASLQLFRCFDSEG